ncbi:hypothetical protein ACFWDP_38950, partial [Streptomyces anthocyanicus]|uniref:hypothetical protein n=1 Tax=Streptomyces anthocyanicus TaxID=68174 RepID=UPI0036896DB0
IAEPEAAAAQPVKASTALSERPGGPQGPPSSATEERFTEAYQEFVARFQAEPTTTQWALWLRDQHGISNGAGEPLSEEQLQPLLLVLQHRYDVPDEQASAEEQASDQSWSDYFLSAWHSYEQEFGIYPDAANLASYVYERDGITGADGQPIAGEDLKAFVADFQQREFGRSEPHTQIPAVDPAEQEVDERDAKEPEPQQALVNLPAQAAKELRDPQADAPAGEPSHASTEAWALTASDRYYLAWMKYQDEQGSEPSDEQLSVYCAQQGLLGRGNKPISTANLRRHFVRWRVYNVWAEQREHTENPAHSDVAQMCADRGITAQYKRPLTSVYIAEEANDFERRWQALTHHHARTQL